MARRFRVGSGIKPLIPKTKPPPPEPTMRQERTVQASIFDLFAEHEIGRKLKAMSLWLDEHRDLIGLVAEDLRRRGLRETGRRGLPAETVLRCALLKQQRQLSYEELAFHLEDSASFRAFARLSLAWSPKKSVLHQTISALRPQTWEAVHQALLASAQQEKLESGATVRIDSTVSAALMHQPSDSTLLWDGVRVMTRLLRRAGRLPEGRAERWRAGVNHYLPLIARIIDQSERRVLKGEAVPAGEKLVSLFEPHADIIVKGGREVQYGHKLNLATGKSGLILDVVIEDGNPADAERFLPMLDRQIARRGAPPRQTAADGGYASRDNLKQAKERGVHDVAFHKKCGIAVADMVKSPWVYRRLRNFRAGIEAGISCFKRAYGGARCTWRGLDHFKTYIWSAVVAHNLVLFARLKPT